MSEDQKTNRRTKELTPYQTDEHELPHIMSELMREKGITDAYLAKAVYNSEADRARQLIARIRRGEQKPKFEELIGIAKALKVSIDYLVGRKQDPSDFESAADVIRSLEQLRKVMYDFVVEIKAGRIPPNANVKDPNFVNNVLPPHVEITMRTHSETIVSFFRKWKAYRLLINALKDSEDQEKDARADYKRLEEKLLSEAESKPVPACGYMWPSDQDGKKTDGGQKFWSHEDAVKYAQTMGYQLPDEDARVETSQPRDGTSSSHTTKRGSGQEGRAKGSL